MVKINQNKKEKSKLIIKNSLITRNKHDKKNNKKLANHVKLSVMSGGLDLPITSGSINFPNSYPDHDRKVGESGNVVKKTEKNSFNKLFKQSKAQKSRKQNADYASINKISENKKIEITSNVLPVKSLASKQDPKPVNFVTKKPCVAPIVQIPRNVPQNATKELDTNILSVKPLPSKIMKHLDKIDSSAPKKRHIVSTNTPNLNGISKMETKSVIVPKSKRKTVENGWIVEEMVASENSNVSESPNRNQDSYLEERDVKKPGLEPKTKNYVKKRSKPQKSMLLVSQSPKSSENSDDSSESSQENFVKIKRKSKGKLEERSSSEIVPYVYIKNGEADMSTDSEYDPSWIPSDEEMDFEEVIPYIADENGDDMITDSEYGSSWSASSDDPLEGNNYDNEYIEYSAEEVEFDSDESGTEYNISDSEDSESVDDSCGTCLSNDDSYDSEDDEDYVPEVNEDLFICRGNAKIYDVLDNNISFNSDEGTQIFEINDTEQYNRSDNDSCPELIPITLDKVESSKSSQANLDFSVIDEILRDSENEEMNSDVNDDDFLSNISACQTKLDVSMDINTDNKSDEEENQFQKKTKFYNSSVSPQLVLLHLKEVLYFHGNFKATLIHGSVESFGYDFVLNKPIEFYSPSCDSLLYLKPVHSGKSTKFNPKILAEYFDQDIIKEVSEGLTHANEDAIILLDYYESKRVESIREYMRDGIFPMLEDHASRPFHLSEKRLNTNFIFSETILYSGYRKLKTEESWSKIPMHQNSKLVVIGGKNVGKSTLVRYLINSNINRLPKILLIDFDIGQPEIYIPQTVSATVIDFPILGPGCFHKVQPKKVLLFGDISVTTEQIKYIHACNMLIQYCTSNEELSAMPWIINTMGYNKGLGEEIISAYLKTIKPTDVVQIISPRQDDNFNQLFTSEYTNQFQFNMFTQEFKDNTTICDHSLITIDAFSNMYERNMKGLFSAKDKRLMMVLAHLGDILDVSDAKWLSDAEVKKINLDDLHIFTSYNLDKFGCNISLLKAVLDMTFVYLCNKNNDMSTDTTADCIGVGLVRHVDNDMGILYLITAVTDDDLELVNALALTNVTIAKAILEKQCIMVGGAIKSIGLSDNSIGTRQVQQQTYRPNTTVNTRSNFVKE